jgi:D-arabinose 1-dehydrogenase-like Zn-dependent alcohol dehydrogenase
LQKSAESDSFSPGVCRIRRRRRRENAMKSYQVAAFGAPLVEAEAPTPTPSGAEVLLEVIAAGVCHSDLHIWEGGYDLGGGRRLSLKDRGIALPLTMGHETAGRVVASGPDAAGVSAGKAYLVYPWIGCGQCATCRRGDEHLCAAPAFLGVYRNGGYADHLLAPHPKYLVDLEGLDPVTMAPFACSGLTAFSALKKVADTLKDAPVAIIGAGGLGLIAIEILKAIGGKGAVSVDIDPVKREAAIKTGALAAVDPRAPDALAQLSAALGGPATAVVDFVGSGETAALGFNALGKGGRLVIVGLYGGAAPWSLPLIPMRAISIIGSYVGSLAELRELVDLVRAGKVAPLPVTRCALHDADRALNDLRAGRIVGRAVLMPHCAPA